MADPKIYVEPSADISAMHTVLQYCSSSTEMVTACESRPGSWNRKHGEFSVYNQIDEAARSSYFVLVLSVAP